LREQWKGYKAQMKQILSKDILDFNTLYEQAGLNPIIIPE